MAVGFFCLICAVRVPADTSGIRILVVKSRNSPFYSPAVEGLIKGLGRRGYADASSATIDVIALTGDNSKDIEESRVALKRKPKLVVTLGTDATMVVIGEKPNVPVVFTMILDPVSLGLVISMEHPGSNVTGTTILVDPGKQFDALLQTAPRVKRIGVLYSQQDKTSAALIDEATKESAKMGLTIVAEPVSDPKTGVNAALDAMKGNVDAVWLIPDPASSGASALEATLDFARPNSLPVLGSSAAAARAGAVLSLAANISDLGDLTAEMAASLLDGNVSASEMRVRGPRQTTLTLNLISAQQLRLTVPESVLHLADDVIDGKQ